MAASVRVGSNIFASSWQLWLLTDMRVLVCSAAAVVVFLVVACLPACLSSPRCRCRLPRPNSAPTHIHTHIRPERRTRASYAYIGKRKLKLKTPALPTRLESMLHISQPVSVRVCVCICPLCVFVCMCVCLCFRHCLLRYRFAGRARFY